MNLNRLTTLTKDKHDDKLANSIAKAIIKEYCPKINSLEQAITEWIQKDLKDKCIPPIKGDITKGKLRWRGLRLINSADGKYISQRGNRISPIFSIEHY